MQQPVPFRLKVCGVRIQSQLAVLADAGVDAVGLNFYPPSRRFIDPASPAAAQMVQAAAAAGLSTVGLFVDADPQDILRIAGTLGLDHVQLHGDEPLDQIDALIAVGCSVIRAVRLATGRLHAGQIAAAVTPYRDRDVTLLLDADVAGFGGAGQRLDWAAIGDWNAHDVHHRWVLAGGLTPANVAEAIEQSGAAAVDVASGVESPAGIKSIRRIEAFAAEVASVMTAEG